MRLSLRFAAVGLGISHPGVCRHFPCRYLEFVRDRVVSELIGRRSSPSCHSWPWLEDKITTLIIFAIGFGTEGKLTYKTLTPDSMPTAAATLVANSTGTHRSRPCLRDRHRRVVAHGGASDGR